MAVKRVVLLGETEWDDLVGGLKSAAHTNEAISNLHHATESEKAWHLRMARILRNVAEQVEVQAS